MQDAVAVVALAASLLAGCAGAFAFLWSELRAVETRLRRLEGDYVFLEPWVAHIRGKLRKLHDGDARMEA